MKTVFITGISGQAGTILARNLHISGYKVVGLIRRNSTIQARWRINPFRELMTFEYGDVTDPFSIISLLEKYKPEHFYNLAAQSHVWISFKEPSHTFDVVAKGTLNCLEALRQSSVGKTCRFFQASSSEMFGGNVSFYYDYQGGSVRYDGVYPTKSSLLFQGIEDEGVFQDENTPLAPQSPYAIAKVAAHNFCQLYRTCYKMDIRCGIMGNYESPLRGEEFVTKKIIQYLAQFIKFKLLFGRNMPTKLQLGNVDSYRDWTHAEDTMKAVQLMMEQDKPDDYIIGTGETRSVREFLNTAIKIANELYPCAITDDIYEVNKLLYRPSEVPYLRMRPEKIKAKLQWKPERSFEDLVKDMLEFDVRNELGEMAKWLD